MKIKIALIVTFGIFSQVSYAGVGTCEATASNEDKSSRLNQEGCSNLGKMILGHSYKGISGENIYLEKCTQKGACGTLFGKYHPGIDYVAKIGTPVFSPLEGKVVGIDAANGTIAVKKTALKQKYYSVT